jgi:hypothetical protein
MLKSIFSVNWATSTTRLAVISTLRSLADRCIPTTRTTPGPRSRNAMPRAGRVRGAKSSARQPSSSATSPGSWAVHQLGWVALRTTQFGPAMTADGFLG